MNHTENWFHQIYLCWQEYNTNPNVSYHTGINDANFLLYLQQTYGIIVIPTLNNVKSPYTANTSIEKIQIVNQKKKLLLDVKHPSTNKLPNTKSH